jgi:hypothetical protein
MMNPLPMHPIPTDRSRGNGGLWSKTPGMGPSVIDRTRRGDPARLAVCLTRAERAV